LPVLIDLDEISLQPVAVHTRRAFLLWVFSFFRRTQGIPTFLKTAKSGGGQLHGAGDFD